MPAVEKLDQPSILSFAMLSTVVRAMIGGLLMGLANLVPGISGGTMLLAVGVYPQFIAGIAEVTTLRFRAPSLVLLGSVGLTAVLAIALLAGPVVSLVLNHRWVMYSIFIGLTLGGVPLLWRLVRPLDKGALVCAAVGFLGMAAIGFLQAEGAGGGSSSDPSMALLFIAGVLGASAMILPGISGGYLLLVMGCYVPILGGIDRFKNALKGGDLAALIDVTTAVILPVGVGVVVGIVGVSHLVKALLHRYEKATLGFLLGLLVGAVIGLWPYQEVVPFEQITIIKNQAVTVIDGVLTYAASGAPVKSKDFPVQLVSPGPIEAAGGIALIVLGFLSTTLLARLNPESK